VLGARPLLCATAAGELGVVALAGVDPAIELRLVESTAAVGGYVDDRRAGERERVAEATSVPLDRHAIDDLGSTVLAVGAETGVLVLTGSNLHGSVPVDLYRTLAANLRNFGVLVVADLSGDEQREALAGGVDILKVSHEELAADGWSDADDEDGMAEGAAKLVAHGAGVVVVTAPDRVIAVSADGHVLRATGPRLDPVEPRGAGDSLTAGLALALRRGESLDDAMRLGMAAATVNVARHGLGSGERAAIEAVRDRIDLEVLT
jgi:1-phosphofructokinase